MAKGWGDPLSAGDALGGLRHGGLGSGGVHTEPTGLLEVPAPVFVVYMVSLDQETVESDVGNARFLLDLADGGLGERLARFDHSLRNIPAPLAEDEQTVALGVGNHPAGSAHKAESRHEVTDYAFETMRVKDKNISTLKKRIEHRIEIVVSASDTSREDGSGIGSIGRMEAEKMVEKRYRQLFHDTLNNDLIKKIFPIIKKKCIFAV